MGQRPGRIISVFQSSLTEVRSRDQAALSHGDDERRRRTGELGAFELVTEPAAALRPQGTARGLKVPRAAAYSPCGSREKHNVDDVSLHAAGRADQVEVRRQDRDLLYLGIRRFARGVAAALRQGQEAAMGRRRTDRLVARSRPREPDDARRPRHPDLWHRHLEPDDRAGAPRGAPPPAGLADLAVHARRAGRADRHLEDRADRARTSIPNFTRRPR